MSFIKKHFDRILWMTLVVFLLFFLYKCKGEKNKNQELAAAAKSLEAKVKADSIERNRERHNFLRAKAESEATKELLAIEKEEADNKVQAQRKDIDRLIATIRNNSGKPVDTADIVIVSKKYKTACDSVPAKFEMYELALADRDTAINSMLDLYDYEIQIRDEELFKEMNYSDSLKVDFVRQAKLLKAALQQGKPRGQFLIGIGIMGNEDQFLGGASGKAAYLTKGGKMYQYSSHVLKLMGMENAKLYHELSVFFNPFK